MDIYLDVQEVHQDLSIAAEAGSIPENSSSYR
jgi:hypothetical protein